MKNIPLFKVFMSPTANDAVNLVLNSGYIGQGTVVEEFENKLKCHFNVDYLLTTNSATSAEHLILHLLKKSAHNLEGICVGDEVLCTPMTCTASNWPVLANNFKIKWVDIDEKTLNIDLDDLERKISINTRAIMLVHWGGYPVDLDRVKQIQEKYYQRYNTHLFVIEDCAHAFGSKYKNKLIGTHGNYCTFSLQAIKHITAIDGGILITPNIDIFNRAKLIRWYGIDRECSRKDFRCEANIEEWGFKFHMNDVNATVGIANLKYYDEIVNKYKDNGNYYDINLYKCSDGIKLLERDVNSESAFWIYSLLVEKRESFIKYMSEKGIMTSQVHERNDKHTCVKEYKSFLPTLEKTIGKVVSIPVGWWVTNEDREYIVDCIKKGW